jgi:hypothetical protein
MMTKNRSVMIPVILYRILMATAVVGAGLPAFAVEEEEALEFADVALTAIFAVSMSVAAGKFARYWIRLLESFKEVVEKIEVYEYDPLRLHSWAVRL